jgi:PTH1 family peptidyl-tRNA hydrolase
MKLVVGLGNKGEEYYKTRHNVGFVAIDAITLKKNISIDKVKFGGLYNESVINGEKIIFLKPQRYINLSGEVIKKFIDFFKIDIENILIIHDDLDLPCGSFKLKYKGGSAGHNGLKDIEKNLGTKEYKRIKIGISNNKQIDTKNYVLGKVNKEEEEKLKIVIDEIVKIFDDYLEMSFDNLMNKYNVK